jgi:hypothetical protein
MICGQDELSKIKRIVFEGPDKEEYSVFNSVADYKNSLNYYGLKKEHDNSCFLVINNTEVIVIIIIGAVSNCGLCKIGYINENKITVNYSEWFNIQDVFSDKEVSCKSKEDILFLVDKF